MQKLTVLLSLVMSMGLCLLPCGAIADCCCPSYGTHVGDCSVNGPPNCCEFVSLGCGDVVNDIFVAGCCSSGPTIPVEIYADFTPCSYLPVTCAQWTECTELYVTAGCDIAFTGYVNGSCPSGSSLCYDTVWHLKVCSGKP